MSELAEDRVVTALKEAQVFRAMSFGLPRANQATALLAEALPLAEELAEVMRVLRRWAGSLPHGGRGTAELGDAMRMLQLQENPDD